MILTENFNNQASCVKSLGDCFAADFVLPIRDRHPGFHHAVTGKLAVQSEHRPHIFQNSRIAATIFFSNSKIFNLC